MTIFEDVKQKIAAYHAHETSGNLWQRTGKRFTHGKRARAVVADIHTTVTKDSVTAAGYSSSSQSDYGSSDMSETYYANRGEMVLVRGVHTSGSSKDLGPRSRPNALVLFDFNIDKTLVISRGGLLSATGLSIHESSIKPEDKQELVQTREAILNGTYIAPRPDVSDTRTEKPSTARAYCGPG